MDKEATPAIKPRAKSEYTASATLEAFPFERLPVELQLLIIRYAMPQHGIRPLTRPYHEFNPFKNGIKFFITTASVDDPMTTALFRANRWISGNALAIFEETVSLHIDISPGRVRFLERE
ncbi:MAG: hypothetical protein Q9183_007635, partial [Haloplaca sp. 2 TL-2023]